MRDVFLFYVQKNTYCSPVNSSGNIIPLPDVCLLRAGILFVVREVLPVASNWRYEKPGEREQILQLSLAAVLQYVTAVPEGKLLLTLQLSRAAIYC